MEIKRTPEVDELLAFMEANNISRYAITKASGVFGLTIANWSKGVEPRDGSLLKAWKAARKIKADREARAKKLAEVMKP